MVTRNLRKVSIGRGVICALFVSSTQVSSLASEMTGARIG